MGHDVFISYSLKDLKTAVQVCDFLEKSDIRCWLASRDFSGEQAGASVKTAIEGGRVFVMILTSSYERSIHTKKELEQAIDNKNAIVMYRMAETQTPLSLNGYMGNVLVVDASDSDEARNRLAAAVKAVLEGQDLSGSTPVSSFMINKVTPEFTRAMEPSASQMPVAQTPPEKAIEPAKEETIDTRKVVENATPRKEEKPVAAPPVSPAPVASQNRPVPASKPWLGGKKLTLLVVAGAVGILICIFGVLLVSVVVILATMETQDYTTVKAGDIVSVDYVAKYQNGTIFETSIESVALQAGIYNSQYTYQPFKFSVLANPPEAIDGLDEAVIGMKSGESKSISVPPEKGYGYYNSSLVYIYSKDYLIDMGIYPVEGQTIYLDKIPGVIINIDSNDLVSVDFNSPLAGKTVLFDITVRTIN